MDHRDRYRTWSGRHGMRLPRVLYSEGYPVHVTICALRSTHPFRDAALAAEVFRLLHDHPATLAACLMPDHAHWLLAGTVDFSRAVQGFKSLSTRIAWNRGRRGKLWQRSFHDHVVRKTEDLFRVALYIVHNPVRAGLVERRSSFPFQMVRLDNWSW